MEKEHKNKSKTIKKALRLFAFIALFIVLVPFVVAGLLLIPSVQQQALRWATAYASSYLGSEVQMEGIYLEPFRTLRIDGVLIRDVFSDTLIHADAIHLKLNYLDREKQHIFLDLVEVHQAYFNLYTQPGDSLTNLDYLLDVFASADTSASAPVVINCDEVILDKLRFSYSDGNKEPMPPGMVDFDHIFVEDLSGRISDIVIHDDSINATIHGLHFTEQSGFVLRYLSGKATVSSRLISCDEMMIVTNRSVIQGRYAMHTKGWGDYSDFIEAVHLESRLLETDVHFHDIAFFEPSVHDILLPMEFSGEVTGTISNLKGTIDSLRFGNSGWLQGKAKLKGLPEIESTFIDAQLKTLYASVSDIEQVNIPDGDSVYRLELPEEVKRISYVNFTGKFTGFISDFVAYGRANTGLGSVSADINVKSSSEKLQYSGQLASQGFNLGALLDIKETIQDIAFDLDMKGEGLEFKTMMLEAKGSVNHLGVLGYTYKNISVDGLLDERMFEGNVSVRDTNIHLDFTGMVDMKGDIPQVNCVSNVERLHLGNLNLVPSDTFGVAKGKVVLEMQGKSLHNLHGKLTLVEAAYENAEMRIAFDTCVLTDNLIPEGHDIWLTTDLVSVHVSGNTDLFSLPYAVIKVAREYAPGQFPGISLADQDTLQDFAYSIKVRNDKELLGLLVPDLKMGTPLVVHGNINSMQGHFTLNMDSLNWRYQNTAFTKNTIRVYPDADKLNLDFEAEKLTVSNDYFLEQFSLHSSLRNDSLNTLVSWNNQTEQADSGYLSLLLYRSEEYPFNAQLNDLQVRVAGVTWQSAGKASLHADTNSVMVSGLKLESPTGFLTCHGKLSYHSEEHMFFDVANFDLSYLSNFGFKVPLRGIFNGEVDFYRLNESFVADADITVDSLVIGDFPVGTLTGQSRYSDQTRGLWLNASLDYQNQRSISLQGDYYPFRNADQLDVEASFHSFRLGALEPFFADYISGVEGTLDGSVSVSGNMDAPQLRGAVELRQFKTLVQYLNTTYRIPQGEVKISPDLVALDAVKVLDEKGDSATLNMSLFHENFGNLSYDIAINATNFLCLNTTVAQNEMYYGRAVITGDINISGYEENTRIDMVASTNRGTQLSIPLDMGGSVNDLDYIYFVEPKNQVVKLKETSVLAEELSGLELDFRLSVNDDAEVQIIFDEKIGDIIKVRGNGDMLMQIDTRGKFNMYGDYMITSGDYLFTLQNIINKRFSVQSGSKITWTGSPYNAKVDLSAIYKLRATPANLPGIDSSAVYKQRMPVDVYLNMKGDLLEPYITFDVDLPSLPESDLANQLLDPATTSEQNLNRQVFSLLLFNNFAGGGGNTTLGGVGRSTSYEMLSNQFSNWISQYFDNIDIGVNLRKGDGQNTTDQGEVSFSTELFKDRVLVEVNGSVQGSTTQSTNQSNNVAGEFNLEYKIDRDGSLRARVFNEANNYNPTNLNQSPYTQGVGIFYREEFDTFGEFFRNLFSSEKKKKKRKKEIRETEQEEDTDQPVADPNGQVENAE